MTRDKSEILEWCKKHNACSDAVEWVKRQRKAGTLLEAWHHPKLQHDWRVWAACIPGVLTLEEVRQLALYSARQCEKNSDDTREVFFVILYA